MWMLNDGDGQGTFSCSICKVETPHCHNDEQLNAYNKTRTLDYRVREVLERNLELARTALQRFDSECPTCRSVSDGYVRHTVGSANPFDLGMHREEERAYCPICKRCVYDGK